MKIHAMAAMKQGGRLAPWDYPCPPLGPFECLVKVHACGLCYSDVHMIENDWQMSRYPLVPGHEVVGEIVEVGAQVSPMKPRDRVGIGWQRSACLNCHLCLSGREHLCAQSQGLISDGYGGFADHVVVDSRFCFLLSDSLQPDWTGPLLCGGITVYSALRSAGMTSGQDIGVIGLGGLGHLAVAFAAKLGNSVTLFSSSEGKMDYARQLGAGQTILIKKDGRPNAAPVRPLDIVISTIPAHLPWDDYVDLLAPDGTLTFVGVPNGPFAISLDKLLLQRRRVMGSPIGGRGTMRDTLDLAERFDIKPVVETFPLSHVNEAIDALRKNHVRFRAVVIP